MRYSVAKRTFSAKSLPAGSAEREVANCNPISSEYMPSYKWVLLDSGKPTPFHYRTRGDAGMRGDGEERMRICDRDMDDLEGVPFCAKCGGLGIFLGQLGRLLWFRCRACGFEFNRAA